MTLCLEDTRGLGEECTKIQATFRPENKWPEIWSKTRVFGFIRRLRQMGIARIAPNDLKKLFENKSFYFF